MAPGAGSASLRDGRSHEPQGLKSLAAQEIQAVPPGHWNNPKCSHTLPRPLTSLLESPPAPHLQLWPQKEPFPPSGRMPGGRGWEKGREGLPSPTQVTTSISPASDGSYRGLLASLMSVVDHRTWGWRGQRAPQSGNKCHLVYGGPTTRTHPCVAGAFPFAYTQINPMQHHSSKASILTTVHLQDSFRYVKMKLYSLKYKSPLSSFPSPLATSILLSVCMILLHKYII